MASAREISDPRNIRIAVVGDPGTGKSSLIVAFLVGSVPDNIPQLLPPTRLPADHFPGNNPLTVIDTSAVADNSSDLARQLQTADAIVLTYAHDRPTTLDRLTTHWLPELRRVHPKAKLIVAGCKFDLRAGDDDQALKESIMSQFPEIMGWIDCSARMQDRISLVFQCALSEVLHPRGPLFDRETGMLNKRYVSALKRIFMICDQDNDAALSDLELSDFQLRCFDTPLSQEELVSLKSVLLKKIPDGINDNGFLNFTGFLYFHARFLEEDRFETVWIVLRKFGYDDHLKLREGFLPTHIFNRAPDQSVELTHEATEFLKLIFCMFDVRAEGALRPSALDELFSTAPENPWSETPYKDSPEKEVGGLSALDELFSTAPENPWSETLYKDSAEKEVGGLSLDGYLSKWALMTLLDPAGSMANLIYIGYNRDPASAFRITRRRHLDRKRRHSERNVFQCFVFGPKNAGKSALLNASVRRTFSESYTPTTSEQFASSLVELPGGVKKTLVMREVPEDQVEKLLSNKLCLSGCDIAVFVHDSSDENSWEKTKELLLQVATIGENNGFEVPCLIVSAKDDLGPRPLSIQDSARVSQDLGIATPIPLSMKLSDFNNVFQRILRAAQHPHLGIPETKAGKQRRLRVNRSLAFVSVGVAVALVGLAAYRVYALRKHSSS